MLMTIGHFLAFLLIISMSSFCYGQNPAGTILNLDSQVTNIPGLGFQYDGSRRIPTNEALRLINLARSRHDRESLSGSGQCATCPDHSD
ncbi:MAG: hypothetical protein AABY86_10060, partial [Bdellovibrionota bacterium]